MSLSLWEPFFDEWPVSHAVARFNREIECKPSCDIKETPDGFSIHAELAGVPKDDIKLDIHDDTLTISGTKKQEKKEDNDRWHRVERSYGSFSRSFQLPRGVNPQSIRAEMKDGVLDVFIPKPNPEARRLSVPINEKQ